MASTSNTASLPNRMQSYESKTTSLHVHTPIIVRINGCKFFKFTEGFIRPFDVLVNSSIEATTKDLVTRYSAVTGYTHSDEIIIIISPWDKASNNWKFKDNIQYVISTIAAYTTMRFNYHLHQFIEQYLLTPGDNIKYRNALKERQPSGAYFTANMFTIPNRIEVYNYIKWRMSIAIDISKYVFARAYCIPTKLRNKSDTEKVNYCLQTTGKNWYQLDDRFKYGVFIKWEYYYKPLKVTNYPNPKPAKRTRIMEFSKNITSYSEENVDLINNKYH